MLVNTFFWEFINDSLTKTKNPNWNIKSHSLKKPPIYRYYREFLAHPHQSDCSQGAATVTLTHC